MNRRSRLLLLVGLSALAVSAYWFTRAPSGQQTSNAQSGPAIVAQGAQLYAAKCASCHGVNLEGQANWRSALPDGTRPAPPHNADGHTHHHPDVLLFGITKLGGQAGAPPGFRSAMPAFGDQMTDEEIWATLAFIKESWPRDIRAAQQRASRAAAAQ
ncbi:MAG: c-type cytochrome [Alphaproteobacteria bacterium]